MFKECNCQPPYDEDHCRFALWAPNDRSFVENRAFSLYAIECCGDLPTRRGQIEHAIREIAAAAGSMDDVYLNIDAEDFTPAEIEYIIEEVRKRL